MGEKLSQSLDHLITRLDELDEDEPVLILHTDRVELKHRIKLPIVI